jgi:cobalt-precorrin 5A hydrolase
MEAIQKALGMIGATSGEVRVLSSVDIKCDENGLLQASASLGIPIRFISSGEIREARKVFAKSYVAQKRVGLPAVAEPAALLAGKGTKLILGKTVWKNVTVAIAKENSL